MDDRGLARWRAQAMRLHGQTFPDAEGVVGGLLAVQAENHAQATWAVAARTPGLTAADFATAFDEGRILRTHVLRPTWHFVLPDDLAWLLELTAPRIRRAFAQLERREGIGDRQFGRSREVIASALTASAHLTRAALTDLLRAAGLPDTTLARSALLADAELHGLICSGPVVGGEHTYALLERRAPSARRLERDEALAELARRYFTGHGPATERDLAYWATLTLGDVRAGIAAAGDALDAFEHGGRTFWYGEPAPATDRLRPRAHLLQTLDEFHNGVQDSRHLLDVAGIVPRGRAASVGMVLVDTQMVGGHRRTVRDDHVRFDLHLYRHLTDDEHAEVRAAADRCATHLGVDGVVVVTG